METAGKLQTAEIEQRKIYCGKNYFKTYAKFNTVSVSMCVVYQRDRFCGDCWYRDFF